MTRKYFTIGNIGNYTLFFSCKDILFIRNSRKKLVLYVIVRLWITFEAITERNSDIQLVSYECFEPYTSKPYGHNY